MTFEKRENVDEKQVGKQKLNNEKKKNFKKKVDKQKLNNEKKV